MRHTNKALLMVVAAIACVALYAGAYLANLDLGYAGRNQAGQITKIARYRVGGKTAATFFAPAQKLDAAVRPNEWENVKWWH